MLTKERKKQIYTTMCKIRNFELTVITMFEANVLRGSVHLYVGEEAIASTICSLLTDDDYIASTHRGHGHCIAKGATLAKSMAELMGKADGYCKGHSGSMHIADFSKGNLGANAIVAGGVPIAVGGAYAAQVNGRGQVAVSFFGDGASNEGVVHEAMNMASNWKLPVIFVCENNQYAVSTSVNESTSVKDISVRAAGYDMPGWTVDGNGVEAIYKVAEKAVKRAREGKGPSFIECKTYRWFGHWMGDPQPYRTREEVKEWRENRDPLKMFREKLIANGDFTAKELDAIEKAAEEEAVAAKEYALSCPEPDPIDLETDVFYVPEKEGGAN